MRFSGRSPAEESKFSRENVLKRHASPNRSHQPIDWTKVDRTKLQASLDRWKHALKLNDYWFNSYIQSPPPLKTPSQIEAWQIVVSVKTSQRAEIETTIAQIEYALSHQKLETMEVFMEKRMDQAVVEVLQLLESNFSKEHVDSIPLKVFIRALIEKRSKERFYTFLITRKGTT